MAYELRRLDRYDDTSLISEIRRVAALIKSPIITQSEFNRLSKASSSTIRKRFGSWQLALVRAGLAERYSGTEDATRQRLDAQRRFSDEDLIAELREVASNLEDRPVTVEAFSQLARVNPETIRRRFGSWGAALDRANLAISNLGRRYSLTDYFENLLAVWTHYGRQPSYGEMATPPSRIPAGVYEARWKTWRNALRAFMEHVNTGASLGKLERSWTTEPKSLADSAEEGSRNDPLPSVPSRKGAEVTAGRNIPLAVRFRILRRDSFKCVLCGDMPARNPECVLHVDHVLPWSKGGSAALENLRTLCASCNVGRGNRYTD